MKKPGSDNLDKNIPKKTTKILDNHDIQHLSENIVNSTEVALLNIVENMPGHVYWKDKNGVYLGCNARQARSLGFNSTESVIGKTDYELPWGEGIAEKFQKNDAYVMTTGITQETEEKSKMDEKEVIVLTQKTPLRDKNNNILGVLGISFDITERKKMEEELRIAKRAAEAASLAKTEFVANISHDIRNTLAAVVNLSERLENASLSGDERITYAKMVNESGEVLLTFLNSVIDSVSADTMTDEMVVNESFDVYQIIKDIIQLQRPSITLSQIEIEADIAPNVPQYLFGDKMKLRRILLNLSGNAIKFTKAGRVELGARVIDIKDNTATIEFSVKDTGIGISIENQTKVFERFFKVSPSYKRHYEGHGLGLHIAQSFVHLLGGDIHLTSELDVGTTISFVLSMKIAEKPLIDDVSSKLAETALKPVISHVIETKQIAPAEQCSLTTIHTKRVLLVDDDSTMLFSLNGFMKPYDVTVSQAEDAELAFELVTSKAFDLIISDVGLPLMQGDELARKIRAFEADNGRKATSIIGCTGHGVGSITQACLDAGMNEVIIKPMRISIFKGLMTKYGISECKEPMVSNSDDATPILSQQTAPLSNTTIPTQPDRRGAITPTSGALGPDLPDTEAQLFEIQHYPLLDLQVGVEIFGNEAMARDVLKLFREKGIELDYPLIIEAHRHGDWDKVEDLAHKMKGGANYGAVRLSYALLFLERYKKAGHTACLERLYQQMTDTMNDTINCLDDFFKESLTIHRILLVEDDETLQLSEKLLFQHPGCVVDTVGSSPELKTVFKPGKYALVLMDIKLNDTSGYALAKYIRGQEHVTPYRAPIIALTTLSAEKMIDDCNLYQMDGAISKPLDFKQANQLIQHYILKLDVPVDRLFKTASRS